MNYKSKRGISSTIACLLLNSFLAISLWSQDMAELINAKEFDPSTLLWHTAPADKWENALPVGNGRLGGMIFGGVDEERIQLNEDSYYSGGPYSQVVKGGYKVLPEIQKLLFEGEPLKTHKLFGRHLMGYPVEQQKYQCLGNLHLFFKHGKDSTNYKRWLDLSTGISGSSYEIDGVSYTREVLSSYPDQILAKNVKFSLKEISR
jgi:alpha-L-fucosidase 2